MYKTKLYIENRIAKLKEKSTVGSNAAIIAKLTRKLKAL